MTLNQSALLELTEVLRTSDSGQMIRTMLGFMLQALVDTETTSVIGAALHERIPRRLDPQVDDRVTALGVDTGISKSEVCGICAGLDEQVAAYDPRPLDHPPSRTCFLTRRTARPGSMAGWSPRRCCAGLQLRRLTDHGNPRRTAAVRAVRAGTLNRAE